MGNQMGDQISSRGVPAISWRQMNVGTPKVNVVANSPGRLKGFGLIEVAESIRLSQNHQRLWRIPPIPPERRASLLYLCYYDL